jgi:hypothetical protein
MTDETKTQGIKTETTTKDIPNSTKTASNSELLDLRAGYVQHTSPQPQHTSSLRKATYRSLSNN